MRASFSNDGKATRMFMRQVSWSQTVLVAGLVFVQGIVGCNLGVHSSQTPGNGGSGPGATAGTTADKDSTKSTLVVGKPTVGGTKPLLQIENCYLAAQPSAEDFAAFKSAGVKRVISIRDPSEINWDEKSVVEAAGLEFVQIPMRSPDQLTDEKIKQVCDLLQQSREKDEAVLLHCGAAVRASAVWLAHYCVDQKATWEEAEAVSASLVGIPDAWKTPVKLYVEQNVSRK